MEKEYNFGFGLMFLEIASVIFLEMIVKFQVFYTKFEASGENDIMST